MDGCHTNCHRWSWCHGRRQRWQRFPFPFLFLAGRGAPRFIRLKLWFSGRRPAKHPDR